MSLKTMPYSIEAEESLLGNILIYENAIREAVEKDITAEDFYLEKHRQIFNIMLSMYEKKEKIDTVSLSSKLKDFDYYEKVGGLDYLIQLTSSTISNTNTSEYIRILKKKTLARKLIKASQEISSDSYDQTSSIEDVLEAAEEKILAITRSHTDSDFHEGAQVFDDTVKLIEKIQESGSAITGVKTLYNDLDRLTAGFQKGDLIILAARPSMGKTALALNIALNAASVSSGAIAIFSLEMPAEQLAMRMFSAKSKIAGQRLRTGQLDDEAWSRLNEASQELKRQKFFIDDTPGLKVSEMFGKARKLQSDHGLCLIIVDYIQLIQASGRSDSRQQEVSEISRRLKAMARELKVPVIALSQLSRNVESRENKRPMLSDLRESGALEQDADLVLFLYREDYYKRDSEGDNSAKQREDIELILAKHRNGPTATVKLAFEKEYNAFYGIRNNIGEN